jgi:predicted peptidase
VLLVDGTPVRYLLYTPVDYESSAAPWPLLLFLHGAGERGRDLGLVKREGLPRLLEGVDRFPFVVVSPQCEPRARWSPALLARFLDALLPGLHVDPRRVSLTGLSSGAAAALELAILQPERFAAVVAVAVPRVSGDPCRLRSTPVWLFHTRGDPRLPARVPRELARALEGCGAPEARLTVFPVEGHDAWSAAYARWELYQWLLARRRPLP